MDVWVGTAWKALRARRMAHGLGGEDQLFRVTVRGEPDEVAAFEHLGTPCFRAGWGRNVTGLVPDDDTDCNEVAELVVDP